MEINRLSSQGTFNSSMQTTETRGNGEKVDFKNIKNETNKFNTEYKEKKFTEDEIIKAIEEANDEFVAYDRRFEFAIHEKTKQITVKILDTVTDEVIREVPPEKILDTLAGIWEVAGILVDEEV